MRETRSGSQILFGYLPDQTVDLDGRVWRVAKWDDPHIEAVDARSIREELIRQATVWATANLDGGYVADLFKGLPITVLSLNRAKGVTVRSFPRIWICKGCSRAIEIGDRDFIAAKTCACGRKSWGQFHFVGYHDCGASQAPRLPRCPTHSQVRVRFPGTASAQDISFECPECNRVLQRGLGFRQCECGTAPMRFTVHRAASVYSPRSFVVVVPPSDEKMKMLQEAGGPTRAIQWVLGGMETRSVLEFGVTQSSFVRTLMAQGLSRELAEQFSQQAVAKGELHSDEGSQALDIPASLREEVESQAVKIAMGLFDSRTLVADLGKATETGGELHELYSQRYPKAADSARIQSVEFVDRFPVLTGNYGYTRGDSNPGKSRLVTFRHKNSYAVYSEIAQTEALFVRLRPTAVARWLELRGFTLPSWKDDRSARLAILKTASMPLPGTDPPQTPTLGSSLLTLIHSFCHRLIRRTSVLAGLDRNSLSEYLVPLHLGFFVYASGRGGFVLGGLQALFETELDRLLDEIVYAEHRCALDPGCERGGFACAACLHLGEPSCRWFNRFLDRSVLHGPTGYLTANL